ncbi:MAG TPA: hypothetical protein VH370_06320 [Humisphaera sp.]|jgi:hypothetical protein|nr:hypothetical protein [Humisphaera sp.]
MRWLILMVLACLLLSGCGKSKAHTQKTEPYYEAVAKIAADIDAKAKRPQLLADIEEAKVAEETWNKQIGGTRKFASDNELTAALTAFDAYVADMNKPEAKDMAAQFLQEGRDHLAEARKALDGGN